MKWIEFTLCLVLDALLLTYLIAYMAGEAPPATVPAKILFATVCILAAIATRVIYKEAKDGQEEY